MIPPKRAKLSPSDASLQDESTRLEVNQCAQTFSAIEKLPYELLFAIFEYAPERVRNLRTVSSVLRTRIDEFVLQRTTFQLVDELRLETRNRKAHKLYAILVIPKTKAHLFELRYKLHRGSKSRIKRTSQFQVLFYEITLRENDQRLWECISAASGGRIGRVSIEICFEKSLFNNVTRMLQPFKFKNLEVSSYYKRCYCSPNISNDVADEILNMIATKQIDHLQLSLNLSTIKDQKEYLFKIASLVRSMHFDPRWTFIGKDSEIPHYIIGMLSRKMNKLLIEDLSFRGFTNSFSQEMINVLAKRIPQLGKPIWFQASCSQGVAANSSYPDYLIEVVKRPPIDRNTWWCIYRDSPAYYVDIKHVSRAAEPPMKKSIIAERPQLAITNKKAYSANGIIPPKRAKLSEGISFSQEGLSPLEKLPRELAFAIFEYVPECVQNLTIRMASSTLRNQINAIALERSTAQLVDELRFETLRYQLRRGCTAKSRIKRNRKEQVTLYEIMLRKREYKLWECISAAIGIRIGRFKILVVDSIGSCHICGRSPAIESDVASSLLELIAAKDIYHLQMSLLLSPYISFGESSPKSYKKYLFNLSSLVRSFDPRFAFYRREADIPRIVIGILSRKHTLGRIIENGKGEFPGKALEW
ncbi:hypothetical protein PRIPAC_85955, partial [Pristionchus pacificus]|uniref:Uncharacterized protein n=1 Tax=Pristionchus pacificus TaxID=54126 RepID=A0A2A6BKP9_PRIPA